MNATPLEWQWMQRFCGFGRCFSGQLCYAHSMSYRTIKIDWPPTSGAQWKTFTASVKTGEFNLA